MHNRNTPKYPRIANPFVIFCLVLLFLTFFSIGDSTRKSPHVLSAAPLVDAAADAGLTYYVNAESGDDNNSGRSESEALRTLNWAVTKTNPGDTVLVMNGTYIGEGDYKPTLTINRDGTPSQWITYQAYPGHSPLIQSNGAFQAIHIDANYIIVDGFQVRGIRDQVSYEEAEAAFEAHKNGEGYNPRVHGDGIKVSHFNIVRNNEIFNFGGGGISVKDTDSVIIENNTVYDTSHYSPFGHSGISVIYPEHSNTPTESIDESKYDIIVRGNISHSNYNYFECGCDNYRRVTDGNGIIIDIVEDDYHGWILVANNLVFNNGGSGIHAYKARNVDIINNTAYHNGQHPDREGEIYARWSENVNLVNNILVAVSGQRITLRNSDGDNVRYANNLYFDGSDSPDIPTGLGNQNIIANPRFYNPSVDPDLADFRLASNSLAIDSGSEDFLPMKDITGKNRQVGLVDRGAYEKSTQQTAPPPLARTDCGVLNQEAEDAVLHGNIITGTDLDASGGTFIYAPQNTGFKEPQNQNHRAEFCFTVTRSGIYQIIGRAYGLDKYSNTFYVRVNAGPAEGYLWSFDSIGYYEENIVSDPVSGEPLGVHLAPGTHLVTIYQREDGARLDTLRLELFEPDIVEEENCALLVQEAEEATLSGAFVVGTSSHARGGQYIHVPKGTGGFMNGPMAAQQATFCFEVATLGNYYLQGGVYSNDDESNSFYVQVDGLPAEGHLWQTYRNTRYMTDIVTDQSGSAPEALFLNPGKHEVIIYAREDGSRLDWLELVPLADNGATAVERRRLRSVGAEVYLPAILGP